MNGPDVNKMAVEKIDGGIIRLRAGFSELRAGNIGQTEALEGMNVALYKLERVFSVVKKEYLEKGVPDETDFDIDVPVDPSAV